jgi:hypothetical protein
MASQDWEVGELGVSILMLSTLLSQPRSVLKGELIAALILVTKALITQPGQRQHLMTMALSLSFLIHLSFPHEGPIDDNGAVADIFGMSDQGITADMLNRQMMSTGGYHGRPQDEDTMSVRSQDETARSSRTSSSSHFSLLSAQHLLVICLSL